MTNQPHLNGDEYHLLALDSIHVGDGSCCLCPNGLTDGDWLEAGVFALSVGVGLTPEMLPMIITASLSKGSIIMAKEKSRHQKTQCHQDLGAIDILMYG